MPSSKNDRRDPAPQGDSSPAWRRRCAAATIWYLRVVCALNLLGGISISLRDRVREHNNGDYFTPFLLTAGYTSAAFALFFALMLARRKRAAWIATVAMLGGFSALIVAAMVYPEYRHHAFNWVSLAITLAVLALLVVSRREFRAKGDPTNPKTALLVLAGGVLWSVLLGLTLVPATNTLRGVSLLDSVTYVVGRVVTLAPDSDFPLVHVPHWVDLFVNLTAGVLLLAVVYVLFRAPRGRELLSTPDEGRLRELLERHGARDSLGYFALRRDKSVLFSPSGKAAITYRVTGGVSLASADPIGDPEAWPGAIEVWLAEARAHAWIPAVVGASEEAGTVYARHGFDALELGDEAIVEVDEFTLEGRAMRVVRQAYNRVRRAGYTTRIRRHEDIPDDEMDALLRQADHWRDGETERGFSMALGRLGDPADGRCVMVECLDGDGRPRALLSFVPWGAEGLSLDLMRRDRDSENGLVEFMVIDLLQRSGEVGVKRVSLNFAMFRAVFERGSKLGAGPVLRLWRAVLVFFSRWWQIESLYRANAKFRPIWEPRYVLFEKSSTVPRIGLAYARAEGFLTAPRLPALLRRREAAGALAAEAAPGALPGARQSGAAQDGAASPDASPGAASPGAASGGAKPDGPPAAGRGAKPGAGVPAESGTGARRGTGRARGAQRGAASGDGAEGPAPRARARASTAEDGGNGAKGGGTGNSADGRGSGGRPPRASGPSGASPSHGGAPSGDDRSSAQPDGDAAPERADGAAEAQHGDPAE